ncbi:putative C2 domain-containing protein [Lupinus albus]|uniref:Putative C2 domain-containing protein n=1 Tax=Lupinus albus TaxID=3870 RepID=A0A6A4R8K0_LUPAL|nr:putative C2 domain-containing protein [Lupinus albus]
MFIHVLQVLSDFETVRWLNHAIKNIWPICMEQIASQNILLPIIPWFLEKYKPWTAKEAVVQHLYLGKNPPLITEMRVLRKSNDDHLVLELGMNFLTADDMSAILSVKLRKRLGFGMTAKLHITGMHVEGKVLVGVKFIQARPFISRVRVCFVEPPYFQMTVKPIFTHGLDVTELPGIAGWLDKILSIAFEQTLVEPNMLVVDVEKFISPQAEHWFSVDEKDPVAYAKVEVIEASDLKPEDLNGLLDPYVKGHLGGYRLRTDIQKKTVTPKWHEEFRIPIITWECNNVLAIKVCDKDRFYDNTLGNCSVNISGLRDGQRHDMWLPLENIKSARLHLAITILEDNGKEETVDVEERKNSPANDTSNKSSIVNDSTIENSFPSTQPEKSPEVTERKNSFANDTSNKSSFGEDSTNKNSFSSTQSEKDREVADDYEPIDVEGQKETGIWIHHPGSEVSETWKPRKGKSRRLDTEIRKEPNGSFGSFNSSTSEHLYNDCSSPDSNPKDTNRMKSVKKGLHKIGTIFCRNHKKEDQLNCVEEEVPSQHDNIRLVKAKGGIGVKLVMEENISGFSTGKLQAEAGSNEGSGSESPGKGNVKDMAKNIFKHAGKSALGFKHVFSGKSKKSKADTAALERKTFDESDSFDDDESLLQSPIGERIPVATQDMVSSSNGSPKSKVIVVQTVPSITTVDNETPSMKT